MVITKMCLHTLKGSQIYYWLWRRRVCLHTFIGSQACTLLTLKKTGYKHANPADEQSISLVHVSIEKQHWIPFTKHHINKPQWHHVSDICSQGVYAVASRVWWRFRGTQYLLLLPCYDDAIRWPTKIHRMKSWQDRGTVIADFFTERWLHYT